MSINLIKSVNYLTDHILPNPKCQSIPLKNVLDDV